MYSCSKKYLPPNDRLKGMGENVRKDVAIYDTRHTRSYIGFEILYTSAQKSIFPLMNVFFEAFDSHTEISKSPKRRVIGF